MSGIVGIVHLDGAPIRAACLERMTRYLHFCGPDHQNVWVAGCVGFGHALLQTAPESAPRPQPCSLDGEVWITADARLDGRRDLVRSLVSHCRVPVDDASDAELILHAYQVWSEDCVQHLLGDFAFAIWDGWRRRLFCARDHFGVKPFYYARAGSCLVFSNSLNCLRLHPDVSDELNDLAIADFLLFDGNQDVSTTVFADIQRLPAGHCLSVSKAEHCLRRYWTLPADGHIRYRRAADYVDHFKVLLRQAVGERLRAARVGVCMSGGLDSTSVAATARQLVAERSTPCDLRAFTIVYDRLIPDQERHWSGIAARGLAIPIHYQVADDYPLFDDGNPQGPSSPEPDYRTQPGIFRDHCRALAEHGRVALTGYGGDPVLFTTQLVDLHKGLPVRELLVEVARFLCGYRRLPPLGIRSRLRQFLGRGGPWQPPFPTWFNKELEKRLDLRSRWEEIYNPRRQPPHPLRSKAYELLAMPLWAFLFETCDPSATGFPVEMRHPFFDLRLVKFLLAIPPLPWFVNKELLRVSMRSILPEPVRLRPKAPLAGWPARALMRQPKAKWLDRFEPVPELARYVARDAVPPVMGVENFDHLWVNLRPLTLNCWLKHRGFHNPSPLLGENSNELGKGSTPWHGNTRPQALSQPAVACLRGHSADHAHSPDSPSLG